MFMCGQGLVGGAERGGWTGGAWTIFKAVKIFCMILKWQIHDMHFSKPAKLEQSEP